MAKRPQDDSSTSSRRTAMASGAALLGSTLLAGRIAQAQAPSPATPGTSSSAAMPAGYNILFVLVDQEHFFPTWPFPVPGREAIKKKAITFLNHQAASCVCSSARSVVYTGQHIQHTGIADNLNSIWQRDLSTKIKTIGHRLAELGYHAAYQGKWHLSANLDLNDKPVDAPLLDYRKTLQSYGFQDFFGIGDMIDGTLGGYSYDDGTLATAISWLRTEAQALRTKGQPWYLAVNFVNPHDTMYFDSDIGSENIQGKRHAFGIARAPDDELYRATWDGVPLPASRHQPLDAPGRPKAHLYYQQSIDLLVGAWPDEDRRWRALRNYYFNAIRDCDRKVERLMQALDDNGMARNTIVVFTADHGELGGNHQMRGKGTTAYRQQNHLPLMIVHPALAGGKQCQALTSQLDLTPTILALTGKDGAARARAGEGLPGKDFSALLRDSDAAGEKAVRPAALFNFDMLSYTDPSWATMTIDTRTYRTKPPAQQEMMLAGHPPDFRNRTSIRSIFDGRHRFSRYFSPVLFNTPKTMEELLAKNDLEVYDLQADPDEMTNLALDPKKNGDLILALNQVTNERIAEEVGVDDGSFLPIRDGKWAFPPLDER
ncbi:sulfatase-like hydrolase/transferase [Reyranella sp. MMS21-HV4-11]|uniref:Sulfatase-like hydrolase/transferase n=1 Tax=Reyranella humidisoli TaxID=2849149 RepID=A0ABS6IJX0_9HYPH|nr:sulfatase-like hydrolase/transferase [Reyranella sp. MMS21-HV4-11]MBU8874588.1 sulfatase-like hydrolase/transferase [Reyranella sp. MMS21-HV4-11]